MATVQAANVYGLSISKAQTRWRTSNSGDEDIESGKPEIRRDASPPYDHAGTIVAATAWLAFYVIAAIHHLVASVD